MSLAASRTFNDPSALILYAINGFAFAWSGMTVAM
jgi:hypothetical protein